MPAIFRYSITVTQDDIDPLGHVHNLQFMKWMQSAAIQHSAAQGWSLDRYRQLAAGWVVREHRVRYRLPARVHDELTVLTWVANFRTVRSLRKYKVIRDRDNAVLVTGETDWTYVSIETGLPRRVPAELIQSFEVVDEGNAP